MPATERARAGAPARKVVFVNRYFHPDYCATSQILHDLAARLAAAGVPVAVITSRQMYEQPDASLPERDTVDGVEVHRVAGTRFGRRNLLGRAVDYSTFFLAMFWRALRLLRPGDVLVAKTDPPMVSVPCALAARLRRASLINWMQDVFPEVATALPGARLPGPITWFLERVRNGSMRRAVVNVVLGERMRAHLSIRGCPGARLRIIPNWSDAGTVRPLEPGASRLRKELGLGAQFVVGYSGNLGRAHEYHTLLGAAQALLDRPDVTFLMIGGGALMGRLRDEAAVRKLANIRFLPYQPREALADSLAAADVHLACLRPELEGFVVPCKFYGILAAARPVVFYGDTDGELARVIRRSDCGRVVPVGDGEALARALLGIRDSADRGAATGQRGHRLFLERYTADRAAAEWLEMLGTLGVAPVAPTSARLPAGIRPVTAVTLGSVS